jgi:L-ascorbate metabolism protein UlaG (beta-lactamase superfamily)
MTSITIASIIFGCVFAGGLAGLFLHPFLPKGHLTKETQDVVRLGTGMLSVLSSLMLGLLIATAKSSFDTADHELRAYAADRSAIELDWWQSTEFESARITYVPAQHFSSRGLHDRNRSLWGGFIVEAGVAVVYFAGDSGYCPHFAEIGRRFPRIDLALIPIGAYEPRWFMRQHHVDPEEAVRAHIELKARCSLGMHFGTFQLTDEAIDAPVLALRQARSQAGVAEQDFDVLGFGETREYAAPAAKHRETMC